MQWDAIVFPESTNWPPTSKLCYHDCAHLLSPALFSCLLRTSSDSLQRFEVTVQSSAHHLIMAPSLQHLLFFVAAAIATLLLHQAAADGNLPPGAGIMSIHNDFPSKLYVQCDSDREHQAVDMVWAQEAHRFNFNPDLDKFWVCTIKTTPMTEFPYTPVPAVWGKFAMYVRDLAFRACYPICVWKADANGLALIIHAGDKPTHIYSWSKQ